MKSLAIRLAPVWGLLLIVLAMLGNILVYIVLFLEG